MTDTTTHHITYVEDRTVEFSATVDEDGNVHPVADTMDVLEVHETSLWCSACGRLGEDEYAAHGIGEYWELR